MLMEAVRPEKNISEILIQQPEAVQITKIRTDPVYDFPAIGKAVSLKRFIAIQTLIMIRAKFWQKITAIMQLAFFLLPAGLEPEQPNRQAGIEMILLLQ